MKCPICNVDLFLAERQGVEIDYCPQCRGVWLDRGELDKIIEKSTVQSLQDYSQGPSVEPSFSDRHDHDYHEHDESYGHNNHKKKNFFGEIFDF